MAKRSKSVKKRKISKPKPKPKAKRVTRKKTKPKPRSYSKTETKVATKSVTKKKEIHEWIRERRKEGYSDESIRQSMLKIGYSPKSIEEALKTTNVENKKQKKGKEVEHQPPQSSYRTTLDKLYETIERKGKISLKELSQELNLPIKQVEEWARILNKEEMIDIQYPLVGNIKLMKKGFAEKTKKQKTKEKSKKRSKKKIIILAILISIVFIFLILLIVLIKGGYLVIE